MELNKLTLLGIINSALDAIVVIDARGSIHLFNVAAQNMFGYPSEEMIGNNIDVLIPSSCQTNPDYHFPPNLIQNTKHYIGGVHKQLGRKKSGKIFPLEVTLSELEVDTTHVFTAVLRDLTNRIPALISKFSRTHDCPLAKHVKGLATHKEADDALDSDEIHHCFLFEAMAEGVIYLDGKGNIITVNAAAERILGVPMDHLQGRGCLDPCWHIVHEDGNDFSNDTHPVIKALHTAEPVRNVEMGIFNSKEERYHWLITNAVPVLDKANGLPHRVYFTLTDITERKSMEKALRESEATNRALIEAVPDMMLKIDVNGKCSQLKPSTGINPFISREFQDQNAYDVLPHNIAQPMLEKIKRVFVSEETQRLEYALALNDGIHNYEARLSKCGTHEVLALVRDITDSIRAATALKESEQRLRDAHRLAHLGCWEWNIVDNTVRWSEEQFRIFGYKPHEIQPTYQHFLDALHFDDKEEVIARLNSVLEGSTDYKTECRIRRKNGEERYVLCQGVVYRNEKNEAVKIVGTALDITERKLAEQERENLQRQLQHAQKMEAIGLLTGGIAHEFNNILASILGYTSLTLDRYVADKNSKMADYLNEVLKAGQRARDMVIQMLAFSRGSGGTRQDISIVPLIKESLKMLRATLPVTIEIRQELASDLPTITVDPIQIQQVLTNLCINARDAMEGKGCLDIGLRTVNIEAGLCTSCQNDIVGNYMELSVNDTGIGLNKDILNKIFDPFFSTKDVGKGSGMGLSVVHGIIHSTGGHIVVESRLQYGSSFRLLFPLNNQNQTAHPVAATSKQAAERIEPTHIMVVDDEVSLTGFLAEILRNEGHIVTVFNNPIDAVAFFEGNPDAIDLVITDQNMPQITGSVLSQRLLDRRPNLPVIMCSGYSEQMIEVESKRIGIQAFFNKPVNRDELITAVNRLLINNMERLQV